jgi:hypothetical protein
MNARQIRPLFDLAVDQFRALLRIFPFSRQIDSVHLHHTCNPAHAQYQGVSTIYSMLYYHVGVNRWDDIAQHLTIAPDGTLWSGRNWNWAPASSPGANGDLTRGPFMVEMIGDFTEGRDALAGRQLESLVAVIAAVQDRFELPVESLRFHRDLRADTECPGTSLQYDSVLELVRRLKGQPRVELHEPELEKLLAVVEGIQVLGAQKKQPDLTPSGT